MTPQDELVERLNKVRWDFNGELCAEAATALTSLIAERDGLAEQLRVSDLEGNHAFALAVDDPGKNPPILWKDRALAAEAQVKAARELVDGLNVTDQELARINNMCVGFDGDVKIWAKMLQNLAVFAISARTALSLDTNKGDGK